MGVLTKITLVVLAISFVTFVGFFGRLPVFRHTPIAWLHRLLMVYIPNAILAVDERLTSGRLTGGIGRAASYVMYDRHPTVLIFFLLLLTVGEYLYLPGAWPRIGTFNQIFGAISIVMPYLFLYLASYSDPGVITPTTHARYMAHYPYDFTIFHPGQSCRTCGLLKPARSKHCSVCKRCVHKMDHHCVFINNCVGYGNQHYFLLLLITTAWLTTYGAILGFNLIVENVHERGRGDFRIFPKPSRMPWHDYLVLFSFGVQRDVGIGSVTLLASMTTPLVWGLLAYHIYLIYCGTTTNESMKWQDWQAEMDDGCAFKRGLPANRSKNLRSEAAWTRWPVDAVQILVRTTTGRPPQTTQGEDGDEENGVGQWERVWKLRDIENLYDIGFWDNLVDVFIPNYNFRSPSQSPAMTAPFGVRYGDGEDAADEGSDVETGGSSSGKRPVATRTRRKGGRKPKAALPVAAKVVNSST